MDTNNEGACYVHIEKAGNMDTVRALIKNAILVGDEKEYDFLPVIEATNKEILAECEIVIVEDKRQKVRVTYKSPDNSKVLVRKLSNFVPKKTRIAFN